MYHNSDSPVWNYLQRMLIECKHPSFGEFIFNVSATYPGVYSWVVRSLCPPGVTRVNLGVATSYLRKEVGIERIDLNPIDMQTNPPVITREIHEIVMSMEDTDVQQF